MAQVQAALSRSALGPNPPSNLKITSRSRTPRIQVNLSSLRIPHQPSQVNNLTARRTSRTSGVSVVLLRAQSAETAAVEEAESAAAPTVEVSRFKVDGASENQGSEGVTQTDKIYGKDTFKWAEAWYPAMSVHELDPIVPKAVTILGRPLVIWWDRIGATWQVFLDQCPHRLAPLSEGRIHESGQLQCSYHGWTFGADGGCGHIPQAASDKPRTSPRACATVIPSMEHQGLLFVWPDLQPGAKERAAMCHPPTVPELDGPLATNFKWFSRLFPYGADFLAENVMDLAHLNFAHHGVASGFATQGNRTWAKPLDQRVEKISLGGMVGRSSSGPVEFLAPCLYVNRAYMPSPPIAKGQLPQPLKQAIFVSYCVPVRPGHCRFYVAFINNVVPKWMQTLPVWFIHIGSMSVLDSDLALVHISEQRLAAEGGLKAWSRACFGPTGSDGYVTGFRRWLATYGGGDIEWPPGTDTKLPPSPPREQLMDRYGQHVKECKACSGALRNFRVLRYGSAFASFAVIAILASWSAVGYPPLPPQVAIAWAVASAVLAGASVWLGKFIRKSFYFSDHIHALVK